MAEASDAKPEVAAPAEPLEASEEVSEALLSHEKLPLELPGDNGATSSQAEGGRPTQVLHLIRMPPPFCAGLFLCYSTVYWVLHLTSFVLVLRGLHL